MKHIAVTALIFLISFSANAQDGFYLAPAIGAGLSTSHHPLTITNDKGSTSSYNRGVVLSYNVDGGIGYKYKHWYFQTGIQWVKNGYCIKDVVRDVSLRSQYNPSITRSSSYNVAYDQIGIPLQIGCEMVLGPTVKFVVYAGVYTSYTFSGSYRYPHKGPATESHPEGSSLAEYGKINVWGIYNCQFEQKLNSSVSIFGGASLHVQLATTDEKKKQALSIVRLMQG
jgi:hypothetical protein